MSSEGMAHEEARDALEALALDALEAPERDAVLAHITGCATCWDDLAALKSTAAELSFVVTPAPMPAGQHDRIRTRLMRRVEAGTAPVQPMLHATPQASPHIILPPPEHGPDATTQMRQLFDRSATWIAIAASLVAALSLGSLITVRRERDTMRAAYQLASSDRSTRTSVVDSLNRALDDRDRLIANITGPQVAVVTLAATGAKSITARMFWDQAANAWTFVAHNLPRSRTGRTYQLWLVTATQKISAGTFAPSASGDAIVRATYALPPDALAAVAVTDEPEAGSPQPTTIPLIVGVRAK